MPGLCGDSTSKKTQQGENLGQTSCRVLQVPATMKSPNIPVLASVPVLALVEVSPVSVLAPIPSMVPFTGERGGRGPVLVLTPAPSPVPYPGGDLGSNHLSPMSVPILMPSRHPFLEDGGAGVSCPVSLSRSHSREERGERSVPSPPIPSPIPSILPPPREGAGGSCSSPNPDPIHSAIPEGEREGAVGLLSPSQR